MNTDFEILTGPVPAPRMPNNWLPVALALPVSEGKSTDQSVLVAGHTRGQVSGTLHYYGRKLGRRFVTRQTNKGIRIWRVAGTVKSRPGRPAYVLPTEKIAS